MNGGFSSITRRELTVLFGGLLLAGAQAEPLETTPKNISLVLAPSNLGLRPTESRGQAGTWRAPEALIDAGLTGALGATEVIRLERPRYEFKTQPGTRIRNGLTIRAFTLNLAEKVNDILHRDRFPVVIGGDCSILLGGLYGLRLAGGRGLVHVDGHGDFFHPGNYDTNARLGSAAGMDLALASGRGESLLTDWPKVKAPLAGDGDVIQVGEREAQGDRDRILGTEILQLTAQHVIAGGVEAAARRTIAILEARSLDKVWLHVDLDVLDQAVMPAVDSPGSPGFNYAQLAAFVRALRASGRIAGVNFAIYDPERDPTARYARPLVNCIANGVRQGGLSIAQ